MGRYCTVTQVVARYRKVADVVSYPGAVDSHYIYFAESQLDARLGPYYTVPFSSNNVTATDLAIDLAYAKTVQYNDPKKYDAVQKHIDRRIDDLIVGTTAMNTTSGDLLYATGRGSEAWSSTEDYHSAFGVGDERIFHPDSDQLYDEEDTFL